MALEYVVLPDYIEGYDQYKRDVYSGCGLSNRIEAAARFLRGSVHKGVTTSYDVRRVYTTQSMNEWFAYDYGKIINHSLYVRYSGFTLTPGDWISFATISLNIPPNTGWTRVVTVNYDTTSGLHMFHLPTQGVRTGYARHSEPTLNAGIWYLLRISINLNTGAAELYCNDILVESNVVGSYASYSSYNTHFGTYCSSSLLKGRIDNRLVTLGLSET